MNNVMYPVRIPDGVRQLFIDCSYEVKDENDQNDKRTEKSPAYLPEEIGFVSHHELNVSIKPERETRPQNFSIVMFMSCVCHGVL